MGISQLINLGLFRRLKKNEEDGQKEKEPPVEIKSNKEILKERYENELEYLTKEIKSKTENLNSISQKLENVKQEYDIAVTNLMSTKKEYGEKKNNIESLEKDYDEALSKFDSIQTKLEATKKEYNEKKSKIEETQKTESDLGKIKIEMNTAHEEHSKQKLLIGQTHSELSKLIQKKNEMETKLSQTILKLTNAEKELQKVSEQKIKGISKKADSKEVISSEAQKLANKNVVEAASAVVSSLKAKVRSMENELEVIKKLLDKERKDHLETKNKLEKLQSSKKNS